MAEKTVKVKGLEPFAGRVDGKNLSVGLGITVEVPQSVAKEWVELGLVEPVVEDVKDAKKSAKTRILKTG